MTNHVCDAHSDHHVHGPDCGHPRVRHADHYDYLVGDHLHHVTEEGCVHHGSLPIDSRGNDRTDALSR